YLYSRQPPLYWQFSWLLFLAWILGIFYVSGGLHHHRLAWGLFVLPVVLGLLALALAFGQPPGDQKGLWREQVEDPHQLWGRVHAVLLFLATVGVSVGFLASLMSLVQARRLRTKPPPSRGVRLLSLERLEAMNRRAIVLAFPLLTAGVLAGV